MKPETSAAKILVSACLTGQPVRYDGTVTPNTNPVLERWELENRVVPFCPEVAGGLPVPRPPAEILFGDGNSVLNSDSKILNVDGVDVTKYFLEGARQTLELVRFQSIEIAVLKDRSPSCGTTTIYDGSFSGSQRPGSGVTCALLQSRGVVVFSEREFKGADAYLKTCLRPA